MQEIQETWIWSLGKEDPLEEEMATHSSFLAWEIPWTEEPGRLQSMGSQRVGPEWACLQDTGKQVRESAYLLCLKENVGPSCWSPSPAYKRNSGLSWHQLWHQPQWPQGAISLSKVTHRSLRWCSHILPGKSHEWRSLIGCGPLSQTRLSDFIFTFHFHTLEKEMATHSSVLAWRIPGMGETGVDCHRWGHTEWDTTKVT